MQPRDSRFGLPRKRQAFPLLVALVVGALGGISPSTATTWTVDRAGVAQFQVIQDAVDVAASGDTVLISPGRYTEYDEFDFGAVSGSTFVVLDKPNITIRGAERSGVIIGPETYRWVGAIEPIGIAMTTNSLDVTIENLTIENVTQGVVLEGPAQVSDVTVRGCYSGISVWSKETVTIQSCLVEDCMDFGMACWLDTRDGLFRDMTFVGSGSDVILSGTDGILFEDSFLGGGANLQFQAGASGVVRRATIEGGGITASMSDVELVDSYISSEQILCLQVAEGSLVASRTVFVGGMNGTISLRSEAAVQVEECHILHVAEPAVDVRFYNNVPGDLIQMQNNWWGTTDSALIDQWIVDANDFPNRGEIVVYDPISAKPVPNKTQSMGSLKSMFHPRESRNE